jgi:MEDS: MEthanogen/methylotroph, DcmR Sensory domain
MAVCEHLVQFYETDDEIVNAVVPYLAEGLDADEAVLVIASESHRAAFERELGRLDTDLETAISAGTYLSVDAGEVLDRLRRDQSGEIGAEEFDLGVGALVRRQLAGGRSLRVYGEIVALLWDRGEAAGAIAADKIWEQLQQHDQFMLFCGYPGADASTRPEALRQVCRSHSCVLPAIGDQGSPPGIAPLSTAFAPTMDAPGRVRAVLRAELRELRLDEDLIERGTLAASELATNAVLHAQTSFRLLVEPRSESVWIAVEDEEPLKGRFDVVGRSPHGLGLIAALARRWGVTTSERGKIVWAEIPHVAFAASTLYGGN